MAGSRRASCGANTVGVMVTASNADLRFPEFSSNPYRSSTGGAMAILSALLVPRRGPEMSSRTGGDQIGRICTLRNFTTPAPYCSPK
jgi:hypothetical protein